MTLTIPALTSTELTGEVHRIVRLVLAELEQPCPEGTLLAETCPACCPQCAGRAVIPTPLGGYLLTAFKGPLGRGGGPVGRVGAALTPKFSRVLIEAARAEWEIFSARHGR